MRREFGGAAVGVSVVVQRLRVRHHRVSVTDWVRRLGWRVLWLLAQRSMRLWLAESDVHTFRPRRCLRGRQ